VLVTLEELVKVKKNISREKYISLDCETSSLMFYKGCLFSIIIATEKEEYYFNFNEGTQDCLPRSIIPTLLESFTGVIFAHNAKFDMHFCLNEGLDLTAPRFTIHCTMAIGRVEFNEHIKYSLDFLAQKYLGANKSDEVKEYCQKNHLWEWEILPGKKKKNKKFFFNKVPLDVIRPYAELDARLTYNLGMNQLKSIEDQSITMEKLLKAPKTQRDIMHQERLLTKVLFEMERTGIKLNREFTQQAYQEEKMKYTEAEYLFESLTSIPFVDGPKTLSQAFDKMGCKYPLTEKGNPCFNEDSLDQLSGPLGEVIKEYRHAYKKSNTYFSNYLSLADSDDIIHANIRQGGTTTGRLSYAEPNLQNCNKVEKGTTAAEEKYLVRRCFIPREDFVFAMFDFQAQEYRLMADYAEEMELIEQVKSGVDVHQATANMMGVTRKQAKTINFMLLFGGGEAKLCLALFKPTVTEEALKQIQRMHFEQKPVTFISTLCQLDRDTILFNIGELEKAREIKKLYFSKLPKVEKFIQEVKAAALTRGYIFNWAGRKCVFPDPRWSYKSPNALIQGSAGDIMRVCLIRISALLKGFKSKLILSVHDECICEIHKDEMHLIPEIKTIMENSYPYRHLPMKVEVEISNESWQDKEIYAV